MSPLLCEHTLSISVEEQRATKCHRHAEFVLKGVLPLCGLCAAHYVAEMICTLDDLTEIGAPS